MSPFITFKFVMADMNNISKGIDNAIEESLYGGYTRFELELEV